MAQVHYFWGGEDGHPKDANKVGCDSLMTREQISHARHCIGCGGVFVDLARMDRIARNWASCGHLSVDDLTGDLEHLLDGKQMTEVRHEIQRTVVTKIVDALDDDFDGVFFFGGALVLSWKGEPNYLWKKLEPKPLDC